MICMQYVWPNIYHVFLYIAAGNIAGERLANFVGGLGFANIPQQAYLALYFTVEPLYKE